MKNYILFLFTIFFSFSSINAQHLPCGTQISPEQMQDFYNRDRSHIENYQLKGTNAVVNIPITYHIVTDNNGDGGYTISETLNAHCNLVENFADAEVNFYIKDLVYHNDNSYFYMLYGTESGNAMFYNENDPTSCNVYIVQTANSGDTTNGIVPVCGYSYLAQYWNGQLNNRNGIILDQQCAINDLTTLTHEMGHYLNLPHTFSGWENRDYNLSPIPSNQWERADGSNCTNRGDGFCDTPPDYMSAGWNCTSSINFDDAVGQNFIVDEKNYMSYSDDDCHVYFKPEQQAEVNAAPASYRTYLLSDQLPNLDPVAITSIQYPQDLAANLSASSITFSWDAMTNAEYYLVEFTKSTFYNVEKEFLVSTNELIRTDLDVDETYIWRVKAFSFGNACADYSSQKTFTTSTFGVDVNVQDVFCSGDINGKATITSSLAANAFQLSAYDESSQSYNVVSSTSSNVFNNLAPNDYEILVLTVSGEQSVTQFTVSDAAEIGITLTVSANSIFSNISGGTPPFIYTWSNGTSNTSNSSPIVGENSLYITDANGCFKSASITYSPNVSPILDLENLYWNFKIFPNPLVGNTLYVAIESKENNKLNLDLFTIDGKLIHSSNTSVKKGENEISLDMSLVTKGIYFLRSTVGANSITKKVIL